MEHGVRSVLARCSGVGSMSERRNPNPSVLRLDWGRRQIPAPAGSQMRDLIYGGVSNASKPPSAARPLGTSSHSTDARSGSSLQHRLVRPPLPPMVLTSFFERRQPSSLRTTAPKKEAGVPTRQSSVIKPFLGEKGGSSGFRTTEQVTSHSELADGTASNSLKEKTRERRRESLKKRQESVERNVRNEGIVEKPMGKVKKGDWKATREARYSDAKPGRGRCPEVLRTKENLPEGWTKVVCKSRTKCLARYRYWVYFLAPSGEEIKRKPQLDEYFRTHPVREMDKLLLKFRLPKDFSEESQATSQAELSMDTTSISALSYSSLSNASFVNSHGVEALCATEETEKTRCIVLESPSEVGRDSVDREHSVQESEASVPAEMDSHRNDNHPGILRNDLDLTIEPGEDRAPAPQHFSSEKACVIVGVSGDEKSDIGDDRENSRSPFGSASPEVHPKISSPEVHSEISSEPAECLPASKPLPSKPGTPITRDLLAAIVANQPTVELRRLKPEEMPEDVRRQLRELELVPPRKRRRVERLETSPTPAKSAKRASLARRVDISDAVRGSGLKEEADFEAGVRKRVEVNKRKADISDSTHELISETKEGLPEGWKKLVLRVHLSSGKTPLRTCFVAPDGSRFWVLNRLQQYLKKNNVDCDPSVFSFARLKRERGAVPVENMKELSHTEIHRTTNGLPPDWTKVLFRLGKGPKKGHVRVCYLSPAGNRLWQIKDLERYVEERGLDIDTSVFEFKAGKALYEVKECPLVILTESTDGVPEGWTRVTYQRQDGKKSAGKKLYYFVTPDGKKLWSATALKEYAAKHAAELDLSKFHFSEQAIKRRQAWERRSQGKIPHKTVDAGGDGESVVFGKSQYREVCRTTEGVPGGWTKVLFKPNSGARAGIPRPCFLSPDRRWIWNVNHLRMYLKKHGDGTVNESMFDFSLAVEGSVAASKGSSSK